MILIVGFHEQHRASTKGGCPVYVVPLFRVPLRLREKSRRRSSSYRVQLGFPSLQPLRFLLWIGVDFAQIHSRDDPDGLNVWIMAGFVARQEPNKAMAYHHDSFAVHAILRGSRWIAEEADCFGRILNC